MSYARAGGGGDEANSQPNTVNELVRQSAVLARVCEIAFGARDHGALTDVVVDGLTEAVRRLIPIRGDPEQLRRTGPYGPPGSQFTKRASELGRVHQLTPFVYCWLIQHGLLPPPEMLVVRSMDADLRSGRGIAGRRPGLAAIALAHSGPAATHIEALGTAWSPIEHEHVLDRDREWAGPEHGGVEMPLTRLLQSTTAAHPGTPVVIETLDWPTRQGGVTRYVPRRSDIASQLWQHPKSLLIFGSEAPVDVLHFTAIDGSDYAPGLHFSVKEHILSQQTQIVSDRTVRFRDPYGSFEYFTVSRGVTNKEAVDAIALSQRSRNDLAQYVHTFVTSGVLSGNVASASAAGVRAACVQIADLCMRSGLMEFDDADGEEPSDMLVFSELEHGADCPCPACRPEDASRA